MNLSTNATPEGGSGDLQLHQVAGLMDRLADDPESDMMLLPQLLELSQTLPPGPAKGAVASSVHALGRLRHWLGQLQARQRMHNRLQEVAARLSRCEGLTPLMVSLAEEARQLLDAPLAVLEVASPLLMTGHRSSLQVLGGTSLGGVASLGLNQWWQAWPQLRGTGTPVVLANLQGPQAPAGAMGQAWAQEGVHSLLVMPLMVGLQPAGVLVVADRVVRPWGGNEVDALQQLAATAVRAITRVARADMAQHTLQALHERQRHMRAQLDRGTEPLPAVAPPPMGGALEPWSHLPAETRAAFIEHTLGPLLRADRVRGSALARTLLTYFDHGHNARAAAKVLGVHVNTLHNRLETVTQALPEWDTPAQRFQVHLALRLALGAGGA